MEESFKDKWRARLGDEKLWLGGYRRTNEHVHLELKTLPVRDHPVCWIVGVGPAASFVQAISRLAFENISKREGPFDHVIKVQLIEPEEKEIDKRLVMTLELAAAVAEQLGLLGQEYLELKQADDESCYFSWLSRWSYEGYHRVDLRRIHVALSNSKYLLVAENLYFPFQRDGFMLYVGLPLPNYFTRSRWLISTTSRQVGEQSKSDRDYWYDSFADDDIMVLILSSLHQSTKDISKAVGQENGEEHWHRAALWCFHYALLLLSPCGEENNFVTSDELICHWAAQGFFTPTSEPTAVQDNIHLSKDKHHDDIYQVGNVILQAFSENSLLKLPFSPEAEVTETAAHFLIYHGLIASQLSEDEIFHDQEEWLQNKRWVKMACKQGMENQGWHLSTEWLRKEEPNGPSTLVLRNFSHTPSLLKLIDNILPKLPCLCVLDLSYTPLDSLPPSVWYLSNLRLLSLRGCHRLKSLSSVSNSGTAHPQKDKHQMNNLLYLDLSLLNINILPCDFFQGMIKLQVLMLAECSNLVELPHSISALSGLLTLEVTGTKLTSLPGSMFAVMQKLQSLKLVDNKLLISIPRSISKARALKELHILRCDELKEVDVFGGAELRIVILFGDRQLWNLPESLMEEEPHGCLEELYIKGWHSIMQEEIKLDGHPTLKSFSLINAPHIRCLSLRGCTKLECVELRNLGTLEDLDLSATVIKELPTDVPNLPRLRRLLLMGFPTLSRFPWHKLQQFPNVFCLDHYAQEHGSHYDDQVARVCVKDSRLFYSFNDNTKGLVRRGEFLQSFYVQIAPSTVNTRRLENEEGMLSNKLQELAQKKSPYGDVYYRSMSMEFSVISMAAPPICQMARHVQMSALDRCPHGLKNILDRYPHCLKYLLEVTKSISVTDDSYVSNLSNLSNLDELEECKLHFCHQMISVFEDDVGQALKNAWVSQLKSLIHFRTHLVPYTQFNSLNHLHLEYCPRLTNIMPGGCTLPNLMTLAILYCYNLETIFLETIFFETSFFQDGREKAITYQLPSLTKMCLQELPLLKHLYGDDDIVVSTPKWKELHVRGCWSLRHLPRLRRQENPKQVVEVNGESAWCNKLIWDDDSSRAHSGCYEIKLPPAFASFNEHATVMSYIR